MGAKERRKKELELLTQLRKQEVIDAAKEVFYEKTIEKATIKDIAIKAEVGVASVYRYYTNKKELVEVVAKDYMDNYGKYEADFEKKAGIDRVSELLLIIIKRSHMMKEMFCFLEQYENYSNHIDVTTQLVKYDVSSLKKVMQGGVNDGSIRNDIEDQYIEETIISLLFTLLKKYQYNHKNNRLFDLEEKEIQLFLSMVIKYLKI